MRVKNKKVVYLLGGVLLAILTASSVFAQERCERKQGPSTINEDAQLLYPGFLYQRFR